MSEEKFQKYKELAPDVMDIMNQQIKKELQCFLREVSKKNIDTCLEKSGKTVEEMVVQLMPSQTNKLCKKENDKLHFVWSESNYHTLINELDALVQRNVAHKECVISSNNADELATCLSKTKSYIK